MLQNPLEQFFKKYDRPINSLKYRLTQKIPAFQKKAGRGSPFREIIYINLKRDRVKVNKCRSHFLKAITQRFGKAPLR